MTCIEKQQGKIKGKLESLEEKIVCADREFSENGLPYCKVNDRYCPFASKDEYMALIHGSFYACNYFSFFDGLDGMSVRTERK